MVMTGVGGVDHGKLVALGEKYFADIGNQYDGKIPQEVTTGVRFTGAEVSAFCFRVVHLASFLKERVSLFS